MAMTLNDTSSVVLGSGTNEVGVQDGNGTLNINSGATFTSNGELKVASSMGNGIFKGSGTVNVNGGTLNTTGFAVARNNNDVASTLNGAVNVTAGTVNVTTGNSLIGWRGTQSVGTLNISGGSYNQATAATANMVIGSFSGVTGAANVSGGALTFQRNSNLLFSNVANANAKGTLAISGGNVSFYSDTGSTVGGTGVIDLMNTSNATGTNTINLNGGTLTANKIKASSATGARVINFNGGTLKSGDSGLASTFLASGVATTANVRNGGAILDTNGNNVTVGQTLVHSTIGGDNAIDGGLAKRSAGTLLLTGINTYTGATTISAGTLSVGGAGQLGDGTYAGDISNAGTFNYASSAAQTLSGVISGAGALSTTGSGTLTLAGANTYTGNTTVSTGALRLDTIGSLTFTIGNNGVNNMIDGSGILTLQGTFVFDLGGAAIVDGNTWAIVGESLAKTYAGSFAVSGFTEANDIWTEVDGNNTWTYSESTGVLSVAVVPEPSSVLLVLGGLAVFGISRRRKAII